MHKSGIKVKCLSSIPSNSELSRKYKPQLLNTELSDISTFLSSSPTHEFYKVPSQGVIINTCQQKGSEINFSKKQKKIAESQLEYYNFVINQERGRERQREREMKSHPRSTLTKKGNYKTIEKKKTVCNISPSGS